jgi:hypothetical protein
MKKTIIFILLLATLITVTPKADASIIESAARNLDSSLNQLITAKDEATAEKTLSPEEDLAFRKKVVNDALILSFKEIEDIKGKLDSLNFEEKSDENKVRGQFFIDLGEFETTYRDLQGRLDKETDVEKIKDIARYAKEYREKAYGPIITEIVDFILAFQTDKLVAGAGIRFGKIETDIKKLERASFIEIGYFNRQMEEAGKLISNAKELVNKAKAMVMENDIDQEEEKEEVKEEEEEIVPPTPRELCEAALIDLRSGYGIFVDISNSVKKIIKI